MRRVLRFWLCAFVPCQEWLRTTASSVSQALQEAMRASTMDGHDNQILHIFAELCAVFAKNEIPYGILVGYVWQTGNPIETHYFETDDGRKIPYIMPRMGRDCKVRQQQFIDIANEG